MHRCVLWALLQIHKFSLLRMPRRALRSSNKYYWAALLHRLPAYSRSSPTKQIRSLSTQFLIEDQIQLEQHLYPSNEQKLSYLIKIMSFSEARIKKSKWLRMQPGVDYIWKPQIAEAVSKREIHVLTNWRNQFICGSFTVWLCLPKIFVRTTKTSYFHWIKE